MPSEAIFLAIIATVQVLGIALIQKGRKEDKKERKEVSTKVAATAEAAQETTEVVNQVHSIVNSRYDELKDQLNLANRRIGTLLERAGIPDVHPTSDIQAKTIPGEKL